MRGLWESRMQSDSSSTNDDVSINGNIACYQDQQERSVILNIEENDECNESLADNNEIVEENFEASEDVQKNPDGNSKDIPDSIKTTDVMEVDSPPTNTFASKKGIAEGMMDIALLTANANQLRFLLSYNTNSKTFYLSVSLIVTSLIIQIAVGIGLIFKSQMKIRGKRHKASKTNDFLVGGVFLVTVINVFAASFTTTDKVN